MQNKKIRFLSVLLALVFMLSLLPMAALAEGESEALLSVTVGDGNDTNSYLPSYSFYRYGKTQYVIPSEQLAGLNGKEISALTWHMGNIVMSRTVTVYLEEIDAADFTEMTDATDYTAVYEGSGGWTAGLLENGELVVLIPFDQPYAYAGGDLLVTVMDYTGKYISGNYVYGVDDAGVYYYAYTDNNPYDLSYVGGYSGNFLPKTTLYSGGLPELKLLYPLWIGDTQLKETLLSGTGWVYDPDAGTLTIGSDFAVSGEDYDAFIYGDGLDLTINAESGLTLNDPEAEYGIEFFGSGNSLTLNGNFAGITDYSGFYTEGVNVTVNGNAEISGSDHMYTFDMYDGNLTVGGYVKAVSESSATAVDISSGDIKVTGNVTATGSSGYATAVDTYNGGVNVGGDVLADGVSRAVGIYSSISDPDVIVPSGDFPSGYYPSAVSSVNTADGGTGDEPYTKQISVTGCVTAQAAEDYATGVDLNSKYGAMLQAVFNGPVTASSGGYAEGAYLTNNMGTGLNAVFKQGITATGGTYGSSGLYIDNRGGAVTVEVNGDVTATGTGELSAGIGFSALSPEMILVRSESEETSTSSVLVDGTIDAEDVGVALVSYEYEVTLPSSIVLGSSDGDLTDDGEDAESAVPLDLTVWKIVPNAEGNLAEYVNYTMSELPTFPSGFYTSVPGGSGVQSVGGKSETNGLRAERPMEETIPTGGIPEAERIPAADFEESIRYIIKVAQPEEGDLLSAVGADGSELETSFGLPVAFEGDVVILKAAEGYDIVAAYNGEEALQVNESGDYYVVVPKGGGVMLSAELEKQKFTVTFVDEDGETVLQTSEVEYGETPVYSGTEPTKEGSAQYSYSFAGWTPEIVPVTGNATYTATYDSAVNKYNVTFVDYDGETVLKEAASYDYGTPADEIVRPNNPTREPADGFTFTFAGWTPEIVDVTADAVYTAVYTSEKEKFTITWLQDDGSLLDTTTVEYGQTPVHADPSKAEEETVYYVFTGWTPEIVPVTGNATYTATYKAVTKEIITEDDDIIYYSPADPELPFTDVTKDMDIYDDVKYVYDEGIMNGISDTLFGPDLPLTRGMIATVIYRMEGEPKVPYSGVFSDVDNGKWYSDGVEWAASVGIVLGYGDGTYGVDDDVLREQLAAILYRYAQYKGYAVNSADLKANDAEDVSEWAAEAVKWAAACGVLKADKDNNIRPIESATRAEIAASIHVFLEEVAK